MGNMSLVFRKYKKEDEEEIVSWFDKDLRAASFLTVSDCWGFIADNLKRENEQKGYTNIDLTKKQISVLSSQDLEAIKSNENNCQVKNYVLASKETNSILGAVIFDVKDDTLKIHTIFVNPKYRKKHVATTITQKIIKEPQTVGIILPFSKVRLNIFEDNIASRKVAHNVGLFPVNRNENLLYYEMDISREKI